MMGRVLEVSGAAEQIAYSFIKWLGKGARSGRWPSPAISSASRFSSIRRSSSFIRWSRRWRKGQAQPADARRRAGRRADPHHHHAVPPTPGPLGVAGIFGVDIGAMMLAGLVLAIPCVIGIVLYARWLGALPGLYAAGRGSAAGSARRASAVSGGERGKALPSLMLSLLPILTPIGLIFVNAVSNMLAKREGMGWLAESLWGQSFAFLGSPMIALAISVLLAVYTLMPHANKHDTLERLEEGLQTAGIILLVTGAGGALGAVLRESGAGTQLAEQVAGLPISPVLIPFVIATLVRVIQGSGTVAMITAASISAPIVSLLPGVNMLAAARAATLGALFFSYFNDSMFWVVNRMMGIKDVRQQMMVWSVPTTIAWAISLCGVVLLDWLL